jgi:hypothetical protein
MAQIAETRLATPARWSPARLYLVISAGVLLFFSAAGFVVNRDFPIGTGQVETAGSDHIFGLFATNGWHNLAGLISAIVALAFATRPKWARLGALLKGVFYVGVTASVAIWGPETFWIAANTPDQVVHAALGIGGIATGLLTSATPGAIHLPS